LGLPDEFIDQGEVSLLMRDCGLDVHGIEASITTHFGLAG
jgi:1-deoxy-D-xylulose-5-phosphate synthase